MNPMVTIKIAGLAELQKALLELPLAVRGRALNSAVSKGARVVQASVKENARATRLTGNLEKNVVIARSRKGSTLGRSEYAVLVKRTKKQYANTRANRRSGRAGKNYSTFGDAFYWRFLEFGTKKMARKPLFRDGFEKSKGRAAEAITRQLGVAIENQVKKLRFKK
jgi:HK97 gp10 family phage protein